MRGILQFHQKGENFFQGTRNQPLCQLPLLHSIRTTRFFGNAKFYSQVFPINLSLNVMDNPPKNPFHCCLAINS